MSISFLHNYFHTNKYLRIQPEMVNLLIPGQPIDKHVIDSLLFAPLEVEVH